METVMILHQINFSEKRWPSSRAGTSAPSSTRVQQNAFKTYVLTPNKVSSDLFCASRWSAASSASFCRCRSAAGLPAGSFRRTCVMNSFSSILQKSLGWQKHMLCLALQVVETSPMACMSRLTYRTAPPSNRLKQPRKKAWEDSFRLLQGLCWAHKTRCASFQRMRSELASANFSRDRKLPFGIWLVLSDHQAELWEKQ